MMESYTLRGMYEAVADVTITFVNRMDEAKTAKVFDIDSGVASVTDADCPARIMAPHYGAQDISGVVSMTLGHNVSQQVFQLTELYLYQPVTAGEGVRAWLGDLVDIADVYLAMVNQMQFGRGVLTGANLSIQSIENGKILYAGIVISMTIQVTS